MRERPRQRIIMVSRQKAKRSSSAASSKGRRVSSRPEAELRQTPVALPHGETAHIGEGWTFPCGARAGCLLSWLSVRWPEDEPTAVVHLHLLPLSLQWRDNRSRAQTSAARIATTTSILLGYLSDDLFWFDFLIFFFYLLSLDGVPIRWEKEEASFKSSKGILRGPLPMTSAATSITSRLKISWSGWPAPVNTGEVKT